jgi:diguanylate cyclase (GGDEF)-like protein/PAS domain S-box-containing protein
MPQESQEFSIDIFLESATEPPAEPTMLPHSAEHMRLLADNLPVLIAYFRMKDLQCQFANEAYARTYGLTTATIVGKNVKEIIGDEAFRLIRPYIERAFARERVSYEREVVLPSGVPRVMEVNLIPHVGPSNAPYGAFVMISDITKHRAVERAIRDSEERFAKFAEASGEGIVFFEDGLVTDVNEAVLKLVRGSRSEIVGRPVLDFVSPAARETVANNIRAGFEKPYESELMRLDGTVLVVEFVGKSIVRNGKQYRMTVVRDISERKETEARIQFLAHHDPLTRLPNRITLIDRLQFVLNTARRQDKLVGILFVDLDNFKTINDSLGHHAGDELLKRVAQRLQATIRGNDLVGRLSGDEFVVVLTEIVTPEDVAPAAEKILSALGEPFSVEGQVFAISASIGISVYPRDGDAADRLIRNADVAMYLAKERGRNNFQYFTPSLNKSAHEALSLETGIRQAIRQLEFVLHYQPEVRAKTGAISSVEALIRWNHPELGLLGPDKFIPIAEHRGLIVPIGRWVLGEAMRQGRAWLEEGMRVPVAVNISAVQFKQKDLVDTIAAQLREHGFPGELLELELTESLFLEDVSAMTKTLTQLKDLGVTLAVDDFGTGYSSLSYLKRYPIDKVKIDRSFIRDIPSDQDDMAITNAIINLAESLNLRVVAEGVETTEQVEFLEHHHCDFIQGYLVSRPLAAADITTWLKRRY